MKAKTFKQLGTPTVDAEQLAEMEEIDLVKLRASATAARGADEAELRTDAVQERQPSAPPKLDARLVGRKIDEGEVVSAADAGTGDKKTVERSRTLLPASAIRFQWPADLERDEPKSFTSGTIL
eukprot:4935494-Pleurochrysis_carterae.AAC.6